MGNQSTALKPEVLSDLEETTDFNPDEIREYYKAFMKEVPDMRMTMSVDQFKKLYSKFFPQGDANKFAGHIFRSFDVDGNGRLDFREFLGALSIQLKGSVEDRLEWIFNLYDLDGTGTIEKNELLEMVKSMHKLKTGATPGEDKLTPQDVVDYIMERADINKDGSLTKEEFLLASKQSKTLQKLLVGTLAASSSPLTKRKLLANKK